MTGDEIIRHAEKHTEGQKIDDIFGVQMINECMLMDIGIDARLMEETTIEAEEDVWTALPSDFIELVEIDKDGNDYPYYGRHYSDFYKNEFDIRDMKIRFSEDGTYTIRYYRLPNTISDKNETPEVHVLFHMPMTFYVAARYKKENWQDNPDYQRLLNEYYAYKAEALKQFRKLAPTTRAVRRVRPRRSWS